MVRRQIDIGVITVIEEEFLAVLDELGDPVETVTGRREYNMFRIDGYDVAVVRCLKQGNTESQSVAQDIIADLAPQWLLLVGIAGGAVSTDFTLGDVIVSSHVYDFNVEAALQDGMREFSLDGGPLHPVAASKVANLMAHRKNLEGWNATGHLGVARPAVMSIDGALYGSEEVRARTRHVLEHHFGGTPRPPLFRAGHVASSDRLLKEDTEVLAVWQRCARHIAVIEMEAAGVAKAVHGYHVPFVAIRAISDIVGLKRSPAWKAYACRTAAAFARAFLRTRPCEPRSGTSGTSPSAPLANHVPDVSPALAMMSDIRSIDAPASREEALEELLVSLFDAGELRKWAYYHARSVYDDLPGDSCSLSVLGFALVKKAREHGIIDNRFFQTLLEERPRRRDEILPVAAQWGLPHEHNALAIQSPASGVSPPPRPIHAAPATASRAAIPPTPPSPVPAPPMGQEGTEKLLHDFRYILDRSLQWSELTRLCADPRAHFTCLLHGDASQDLHLFIERIERYLTGECRQSHQIRRLPFQVEYSRALTVEEWTQRLCAVAGPAASSLEQALQALAAKEPVLLIIGTWPLRGLDEPAVHALTEFLGVHLPAALARAQPAHGVRVLVPIEHEQHATGLADPLTRRVHTALCRAQEAGLPFEEFIELELPSWTELEKQLRKSLHLDYEHPFLTASKRAYNDVAGEADPHRRSFVRLADMLNALLQQHSQKS